jgi:hypothetical protein
MGKKIIIQCVWGILWLLCPFFIFNKDSNDILNIEIENNEEPIDEILDVIRKPRINTFENLEFDYIDSHNQINTKKQHTILIYIAGDNDLYKFAIRNIEQLKQLGSNEQINILVHFDFHQNFKPKETRRFYIQRNKLLQIGTLPAMDSGSEQTLIDAATWAIKNYPSEYFSLVLWNHGSGQLNPIRLTQLINPSELFKYNSETKQIELDRSISYIDFLTRKSLSRGICFDDTTGNYLDDQKLNKALLKITKLLGRKIDILLMDACLMASLETAFLVEPYANYLAASEEVVLGPGYNYATMLKPLTNSYMGPFLFAKHIVDNYYITYAPVTQDFTESVTGLVYLRELIDSINEFSKTTLSFLAFNKQSAFRKTILSCGSKNVCTHFDEPSYIDLKHFYLNILNYFSHVNFYDDKGNNYFTSIEPIVKKGLEALKKAVLFNTTGRNYAKAGGLSIYFPQGSIHPSYAQTFFGKNTLWLSLLNQLKI